MWERRRPGRARARRLSTASGRAAELMSGWNFADLWEAIAERQPDALAQRQAGRSTTWAEFDRRADGVAAALLAAGVAEQDKVAQYLYNSPEYLESRVRLVQGRAGHRQHQLPLHRRRAGVPVGQRRRRRRRVPRDVHRAHRRHAPPRCRASAPGCGSTTVTARARTWAIAVRGRGRVGRRPCRRRRGAGPATTSSCSTPAAPPACRRA